MPETDSVTFLSPYFPLASGGAPASPPSPLPPKPKMHRRLLSLSSPQAAGFHGAHAWQAGRQGMVLGPLGQPGEATGQQCLSGTQAGARSLSELTTPVPAGSWTWGLVGVALARESQVYGGRSMDMLQRTRPPRVMAKRPSTMAEAGQRCWGQAAALSRGLLSGVVGPTQEPCCWSSVEDGGQEVQSFREPPRQV